MPSKPNLWAFMPALAGGLMVVMAALGLVGPAQGKQIAPSGGSSDIPSICDGIPGNLVTNCGFETGDFTGWTRTPAAFGSDFGVTSESSLVHSGNFGAFFGATNPPFEDMISQSIPTTAGEPYVISFFLENQGGPSNQLTAMFGSTNLSSLTDSAPFGYTEFSKTVVAASSSTTLSFAAFQAPSFFGLDDVSVLPVVPVTSVPEPGSLLLLGSALLALGVARRRRGAT